MIAEKLYYYDVLVRLVPGACAVAGVAFIIAPDQMSKAITAQWPATLALGTVVSYVVGLYVQAVASWLEPVLFRLWKGKPSRTLISVSERLPPGYLQALEAKWRTLFSMPRPDHSAKLGEWADTVFARSYARAKAIKGTSLDELNSLYALMRSLFVTGCLFCLVAGICIALDVGPRERIETSYLLGASTVMAIISCVRARQYGYYWTREVLAVFDTNYGN